LQKTTVLFWNSRNFASAAVSGWRDLHLGEMVSDIFKLKKLAVGIKAFHFLKGGKEALRVFEN